MHWADEELGIINLGDKRLSKRAFKLLETLVGQPNDNIPSAYGGWAETKAAYRFFSHDKVTAEEILAPISKQP